MGAAPDKDVAARKEWVEEVGIEFPIVDTHSKEGQQPEKPNGEAAYQAASATKTDPANCSASGTGLGSGSGCRSRPPRSEASRSELPRRMFVYSRGGSLVRVAGRYRVRAVRGSLDCCEPTRRWPSLASR